MDLSMPLPRLSNPAVRRLGGTLLLFFSTSFPLLAQLDTLHGDLDGLFVAAQEKARTGDHAGAQNVCRAILRRAPEYSDARILLARVDAWEGMRNEARGELRTVLAASPKNRDALITLVDVEEWDGQKDSALAVVDTALQAYGGDSEFLFRKARLLHDLGRSDEASAVLNALADTDPAYPGMADLRSAVRSEAMRTTVGASYAVEDYGSFYDPMQYLSVEAGRRLDIGAIFARLNYANRFLQDGIQGEVDFYPLIADGIYGFLNYGHSSSVLFPRDRFGVEICFRIPSSFEISLGTRIYSFGSGANTNILTGSLSWYAGDFLVTARPYVNGLGASSIFSAAISVRKYFGDPERYGFARIAGGYTPDERLVQTSSGFGDAQIYALQSQTVGVGLAWLLQDRYLPTASLDYRRQELGFSPGEYVAVVTLSVSFRVKI